MTAREYKSTMSVINSIRSQLAPIHPEGYPFVGVAALASLVLLWLWPSLGWLAVCVFIVWALPNTYQLFARFNPTLPLPAKLGDAPADFLAWRVNAASAMALGSLFAGCILAINRFSPFLYFRF